MSSGAATDAPAINPARRGDHVEQWLKRHRDHYAQTPERHTPVTRAIYDVLDDLLDSYRLHADTGVPLNEDVKEYVDGLWLEEQHHGCEQVGN